MKRARKLLATLGIAATLSAGSIAPSNAVIDGWDSNHQATVKVWLSGSNDGQRLCTGTHIGKGWVLSAKHCGEALYSSGRIGWGDPRTGAWSRHDPASYNAPKVTYGSEGKIDKTVNNPNAKTDLMLLHSPELEAANAPSVKLRNGGLPSGLRYKSCTAYGYGLWSRGSQPTVAKNQKGLNVYIHSVTTYPKTATLAQLHASSHEGILASGDSGGPLICDGVLSGVSVSVDYDDQQINFMSISNNERNWIRSTTGI